MGPIELRSDNAAGAAPEIVAAIAAANSGSALGYGADAVTDRLRALVRDVFEHPRAQVFPVATGTAANALGVSALTPPWGAVVCHHTAHIANHEGGATSLLSGGAVTQAVGGEHFLIDPAELEATLAAVWWGDPHQSQPSVLSLTQATDRGTIYAVDQIAELSTIARSRSMRVHLDGARLANALAATGASPAEMTWRAGVDVVSLGAIKNGGLSTDAIVAFDPAVAEQLVYRVKRAGHVPSKMRFQAAQLEAYLTDELWLRLAAHSNGRMRELAAGVGALVASGAHPLNRPDVNMLFVELPGAVADALEAADVLFYRMGVGPGGGTVVRFVTSWQTTPAEIAGVIARLAGALGAAR